MKKYNKLIRDNIPEIIKSKGETSVTHVASDAEYWQHLLIKLAEEVAEYTEKPSLDELADILEVIHAIIDFKNIDEAELERMRKDKKKERGGFSKRLILDETN